MSDGDDERAAEEAYVAAIRATLGVDRAAAERVYRQHLRPAMHARQMRRQGCDVEAAVVCTDRDAPGFTVTCQGCGKTARLPFRPPTGVRSFCPDCLDRAVP